MHIIYTFNVKATTKLKAPIKSAGHKTHLSGVYTEKEKGIKYIWERWNNRLITFIIIIIFMNKSLYTHILTTRIAPKTHSQAIEKAKNVLPIFERISIVLCNDYIIHVKI